MRDTCKPKSLCSVPSTAGGEWVGELLCSCHSDPVSFCRVASGKSGINSNSSYLEGNSRNLEGCETFFPFSDLVRKTQSGIR